jgi:hypothetical protein
MSHKCHNKNSDVPVHTRIFGRVHMVQSQTPPWSCTTDQYGYLQVTNDISDAFGPANLLSLYQFCKMMDEHIANNAHRSTALWAGQTRETLSTAAFLLGSYMLMRLDAKVGDIMERLDAVAGCTFGFKDAAHANHSSAFTAASPMLSVRDCLEALQRSKSLGWISFADDGFDAEEYAHFADPLNAGLHELVPGKLLATPCPRLLHSPAGWEDSFAQGRFHHRSFSPAYYAGILSQFDVSLCVRLGMPRCSRQAVEETGLRLLDLCCEDGEAPDRAAVVRFLAAAGAEAGALALQSEGRPGHAGALAGAYLVWRHGFTGRQAAAWVSVVRPGR